MSHLFRNVRPAAWVVMGTLAVTLAILPLVIAFPLVALCAAAAILLRPQAAVAYAPDAARRALLHDRFAIDKVPVHLDAIIIGAGTAGLTAACVLARSGLRVIVLEAHNDVVGGGAHTFTLTAPRTGTDTDGARFEFGSGLHYTIPEGAQLLQLAIGAAEPPVTFDSTGEGGSCGVYDRVIVGDGSAPFEFTHGPGHKAELRRRFPLHAASIAAFEAAADDANAGLVGLLIWRLLPRALQVRWGNGSSAGLNHRVPLIHMSDLVRALQRVACCAPSAGQLP